jgi:hypothetical protein
VIGIVPDHLVYLSAKILHAQMIFPGSVGDVRARNPTNNISQE